MTQPTASDQPPTAPDPMDRRTAEKTARIEREAEALRANLRRRKQQQRARDGAAPEQSK